MIARRHIRPFAYRLADLMEAGAERLRKSVERKPRPRPLRFPTEFELVMERHAAQLAQKMMKDITFLDARFWPTRPVAYDDSDPLRLPINKIKVRVPHDQP